MRSVGYSCAEPLVSSARPYSRRAFVGRVVERAARDFLDDACPQIAASIAYRVIFALFPLAIVLTAVSGIVLRTTGSQEDVVDAIVDNMPLSADGQEQMSSLLTGATSGLAGLGLLGLIPLVWAATGLMGAIRFALNRAWDVSQRRPFVQGKAFDVLFVAVAFLLLVLSLGLSVGTSMAERYATDAVEWIGLDAGLVTWLFGRLTPFLLALVAVFAAYRLLPATTPPARHVLPAAAAVALGFTVMQSLFGLYLTYVRDFNALYGSLGAVIAFLYFVYLAANMFLFGAEVAAEIPRTRTELERQTTTATEDGRPFREQIWNALRSLVVRDDAAAAGDGAERSKHEPDDGGDRERSAV